MTGTRQQWLIFGAGVLCGVALTLQVWFVRRLLVVGEKQPAPLAETESQSPVDLGSEPLDTFVWNVEGRPYDVFEIERDHDCRSDRPGAEQRRVCVEYRGQLEEGSVLDTVREVYEELKRDIEQACPHAARKRVKILVFTDRRERRHGAPMLQAQSGDETTPELPEWPSVSIDGVIRDGGSRPTIQELGIHFDWLERLETAERQARGPHQAAGVDTKAAKFELERRYKHLVRDAEIQICKDWGLPFDECRLARARCALWFRGEVVTDETAERYARQLVEWQRPD